MKLLIFYLQLFHLLLRSGPTTGVPPAGLQAAVLQRLSGLVVAKGKLLQPLLHGRNAYKDIKLKLLCAAAHLLGQKLVAALLIGGGGQQERGNLL